MANPAWTGLKLLSKAATLCSSLLLPLLLPPSSVHESDEEHENEKQTRTQNPPHPLYANPGFASFQASRVMVRRSDAEANRCVTRNVFTVFAALMFDATVASPLRSVCSAQLRSVWRKCVGTLVWSTTNQQTCTEKTKTLTQAASAL